MAQAKQAAAAAFKKLVRLVARTVYYDQIPEGEQEEEVGAFGMRRTPQKWDSTGACVVVIDALTRREWVKEDDLAADLRMHARHLRKVLRFLEDQGVVAREHRKEAQRDRQAVPDDGEAKRKPNTYSYVSIDYPLFVDCLRLRIQRCLRLWKDELDQKNEVQQYICRSCGGRYTAFDALSMLDPRTGGFRCLVCRGQVDQLLGTGEAGDEVKRKLRRERLSGNVKRLERQLAPVHVLLNQLKDVPPPDYGSLTGWALAKQAAERERRQAGGSRGRSGGARDGGHGSWGGAGISIDNVEGDPSIEVDLGLAAAGSVPDAAAAAAAAAGGSGAGGDAVETKPALPWLAQQAKPAKQEAAGSSGAAAAASEAVAAAPATATLVDSKADAKAAAGASDTNSQFLQAFLQAYSKQKLAESALTGKPATAAAGADEKDAEEPAAKRQRTEAAAPESVPAAAAEPDAAAAAFEWDDEDGDGDAGGDGDGTGLTPGSQDFTLNGTADGADEFEWED